MGNRLVVTVTQQDIDTKRIYQLGYGPVGLALRRTFGGNSGIYGDEVIIVGRTYVKTARTKKICEQSRNTFGKIKPCRLVFKLKT